VLTSAADYPRAPWWNPAPDASLLPTAGIAGLLYAHGFGDPWLDRATDFCWGALAQVPSRVERGEFLVQVTYEVRSGVTLLDHVPDRARAAKVCAALGRVLIDAGTIALDPSSPGEIAMPPDMAPHPATLARRWFDDATIDAHLDALVANQADDGGWPVNWQIWLPVTGPEWRGWQTVERLKTLRAYGRFEL